VPLWLSGNFDRILLWGWTLCRLGDEFESMSSRPPFQYNSFAFQAFTFEVGSSSIYVGLPLRHQPIEQAGQVPRHRLDGPLAAEAVASAILRGVKLAKGLGGVPGLG
jgi:hypothetical protein